MKISTNFKAKLIGIAAIAIAALAYYSGRGGAFLLGIAGIILLITPKRYSEKVMENFTKTFNGKTIIITALYDAIYWLVIIALFSAYKWVLSLQAEKAGGIMQLSQQAMMQPEVVAQNLATTKTFAAYMAGGAVIFLLISLIAYPIARGLIWAEIAGKKTNYAFFRKFFLLNAGWWAIWLPVYAFFIISLAKDVSLLKTALLGLFILSIYFTGIMHSLYMKTHLIGNSIGNGIAFGIAKVHRLATPYALAIIVYLIFYQPFKLLEGTIYALPASMVFFVIFIAWLRTFVYEVVKGF